MSNRRLLVAGNWKLNGSRSSVAALAADVVSGSAALGCDVLVCPTYVHLSDALSVIGNSPIHLGAQNCSVDASGAFTGEVSADMLSEFGCEYVIVGHSERRALYGETSEVVAEKCFAVQQASMTPILCVGETLEEREADRVEAVIGEQIDVVSARIGARGYENMVIAYEPVWAIGTGKTASPAEAQAVHAMIRARVAKQNEAAAGRLQILYGGSVKPDNAAELFSQSDIDGGLIGGAALDAKAFLSICQSAG
ncbi:MAG: triose-phosphate isomerase [Granulosicoccus sp.]